MVSRGRKPGLPLGALVALAVLSGLALLAAGTGLTYREQQRHLEAHFAALAIDRIGALDFALRMDLEAVRSLAALYNSSENVSRREFDVFAKTVLPRHPSIQALG